MVPETSALHFVGLGACAFRCVCTSPAAGGAHAHALRTCLFSRLRLDFATEPEPWGREGGRAFAQSGGDRGVCRLRRSLEEKPRALLPIFLFPIKPLTICLWDVRGDLRGHHGSRTLPLTPTDGARVKRR